MLYLRDCIYIRTLFNEQLHDGFKLPISKCTCLPLDSLVKWTFAILMIAHTVQYDMLYP